MLLCCAYIIQNDVWVRMRKQKRKRERESGRYKTAQEKGWFSPSNQANTHVYLYIVIYYVEKLTCAVSVAWFSEGPHLLHVSYILYIYIYIYRYILFSPWASSLPPFFTLRLSLSYSFLRVEQDFATAYFCSYNVMAIVVVSSKEESEKRRKKRERERVTKTRGRFLRFFFRLFSNRVFWSWVSMHRVYMHMGAGDAGAFGAFPLYEFNALYITRLKVRWYEMGYTEIVNIRNSICRIVTFFYCSYSWIVNGSLH